VKNIKIWLQLSNSTLRVASFTLDGSQLPLVDRFAGVSGIRVEPTVGLAADRVVILPQVPKAANNLRGVDVVRVVRDEPQRERAVLAQVLGGELAYEFSAVELPAGGDAFAVVQVVRYELYAVGLQCSAQDPLAKRQNARGSDEGHPEPEEEVDLFVDHVEWENALHSVPENEKQYVINCVLVKGEGRVESPTSGIPNRSHLF